WWNGAKSGDEAGVREALWRYRREWSTASTRGAPNRKLIRPSLEDLAMAVYIISYDLHKKAEMSYENLIAAIKGFGSWCHLNESDWCVVSNSTATQVRDTLVRHIHKDDHLFVGTLNAPAAWTNSYSEQMQQWLKNNLK
ncbi:MAG: hypothetical protein ACYC7G_08105, partial [Rudaea sp.]